MERRLLEANANNDVAYLDEVSHLVGEIKGAWDVVAQPVREAEAGQPIAPQ
jgi:flagellin-specific chaperone FliS